MQRQVFFIPGILGDEPKQAALRRNFHVSIDFHVVNLPEIPQDLVSSLPDTGRIIAENIGRLQHQGSLCLIGFSFGANLAVEVANHLTSAGRDIGYLGLIDGLLLTGNSRRSLGGLFDLFTAPKGRYIVLKNILQIFQRKILRLYKKYRVDHTSNSLDAVDCRFAALRQWQPDECKAQGTLLLSVFNFQKSRSTWKSICPKCKQVKIRSDHHHIISDDSGLHIASMMSADLIDHFEDRDGPQGKGSGDDPLHL